MVDFSHIFEKISRDISFVEKTPITVKEVETTLEDFISERLVEKSEEGYTAAPELDGVIEPIIRYKMQELNRSYALIWLAKKYYPQVAELMIPFLKDRPVSAVKIFSGKKDPISGVEAIFVRYARHKPKPIPILVNSADRLMHLVHNHCIDFIPCIHMLDAREPDVFVLDLDAGSKILEKPRSFEFIRYVTAELSRILFEIDVEHIVKFSGFRGFQIWAFFDNTPIRDQGDIFMIYRRMVVELQRKLEKKLQEEINDIESRFPGMISLSHTITTSTVANREQRTYQILVDPSIMKPMGDVRAPFSIHYKTGLVSLPIPPNRLEMFTLEEAYPLKVADRVDWYAKTLQVPISSPLKLIQR